ncbi:MAG: SRPBCC family protein [Dehalococcoidia bacterium]
MPVVESSIFINARVGKVFAAVERVERLAEFFSGVTSVTDVIRTQGRIGDSATIHYSAAGYKYDVPWKVKEWETNRKIVATLGGPFRGTITSAVEAEGSGTRVTRVYDYEIARSGMELRIFEAIKFDEIHARNAQLSMETLKAICEDKEIKGKKHPWLPGLAAALTHTPITKRDS